jgi:hypothetical protein
MGVLPQEPEPEEKPVRVEKVGEPEEFADLDPAEQEELAKALAELEAEEQTELRMKR